eukprot:Gb_37428 [translate_table: standard]
MTKLAKEVKSSDWDDFKCTKSKRSMVLVTQRNLPTPPSLTISIARVPPLTPKALVGFLALNCCTLLADYQAVGTLTLIKYGGAGCYILQDISDAMALVHKAMDNYLSIDQFWRLQQRALSCEMAIESTKL